MTISLTVLGLALVAVALVDMFQTLFHPASHGTMSDWLSKSVWRTLRKFARPRGTLLTLAGPTAMFLIIVSWAGLIVLGCAIVYDQRLSSFRTVAGLASPQSPSFFEAWNISLGSLISLAGESVPPNRWLRLLMSIEALIGLGLVTASVSWLLSVYPIVESRRTLARFANSLKSAAERDDWQTKWLAESSAAYILVSLTRDLAAVRTETAQFPIAYYFSVRHPESELAVALPFIDDLASQAGNTIYSGTTRVAGKILGMQVSDYLKLLAVTFLRMSAESQPEEILASYMEDHFQIKANP